MIPKVEFIEGDPPPRGPGSGGGSRHGSASVWPMVVALLSTRPGVWATVTRTDGNSAASASVLAAQLYRYAESRGLGVETLSRGDVFYARYVESSDE